MRVRNQLTKWSGRSGKGFVSLLLGLAALFFALMAFVYAYLLFRE